MQSPNLITESQATLQEVVYRVAIDWDGDGTPTVETGRLLGFEVVHELTPVLDAFYAGGISANTCRIELDNWDDRFNQLAGGSGIHADLNTASRLNGRGVLVHLEAGYGSTYLRLFTGFVDRLELGADLLTATVVCRDWIGLMNDRRARTALSANVRTSDWITTVAGLVSPAPSVSAEAGVRLVPWAWMDQESQADELRQVIEVEGGWVFVDKAGTLRFWSAHHFQVAAAATSSQVTFQRGDLLDVPERRNGDPEAVYTQVVLRYARRTRKALSAVFEGSDYRVGPGQTVRIVLEYTEPALSPQALVAPTFATTWGSGNPTAPYLSNDPDWIAYTASRRPVFDSSEIEVTVVTEYAQACVVEVENKLTKEPIVLERLRRRAFPVTNDGDLVAVSDSGAAEARVRDLDGLTYVGDELGAQAVAERYRQAVDTAPVTVSLGRMIAYPSLELGDRITVPIQAGRTGSPATAIAWSTEQYWVTRLVYTLDDAGFLMAVDGILADSPYACSTPAILGTSATGTTRTVMP